jgi:hypothetical protein
MTPKQATPRSLRRGVLGIGVTLVATIIFAVSYEATHRPTQFLGFTGSDVGDNYILEMSNDKISLYGYTACLPNEREFLISVGTLKNDGQKLIVHDARNPKSIRGEIFVHSETEIVYYLTQPDNSTKIIDFKKSDRLRINFIQRFLMERQIHIP